MPFPMLVLWAFLSAFGGTATFDVTAGSPTKAALPRHTADVTAGSPTLDAPQPDVTGGSPTNTPPGPVPHSSPTATAPARAAGGGSRMRTDVTAGSPTGVLPR